MERNEQEMAALSYEAIWERHGGSFHGPNVEHVSMEHSKFPHFCKALIDAASPPAAPKEAALREALELILPLAKGYAPPGQSAQAKETCRSWIAQAEAALSEGSAPALSRHKGE